MASTLEVALSGLTLVAIAAYSIVAWSLVRRPTPHDGRGAVRSFALWWGGLAILGIFGIGTDLGLEIGELGLNGALVVLYALLALILAMIAGLVYFLLYVYSGRRSWGKIVAVVYLLLGVALVWVLQHNEPFIATEDGKRMLEFRYESPTLVSLALALAFIGPALAAAVGYFLLGFRVDDATTKYRIFMTSGGIAVWMAYSLTASATRAVSGAREASIASQAVSQGLGLVAALLVLLAYFPPRGMREKYGLRSITEETTEARSTVSPARRVAPSAAFPGPA